MHAPKRMNHPRRMNAAPAPSMFPHTVTIYNVSVETDKTTFQSATTNHITVLRGVLLDKTKAANVRESGLEGADAATLYIPFGVEAVDGVTGKPKKYIPPIGFWKSEDKSGTWTLAISKGSVPGDGYTFVVQGIALPPEGVKPEMVAEVVEANYDNVYHISKVDTKDFGGLAHFEVGCV